jgi:hypothetical protein
MSIFTKLAKDVFAAVTSAGQPRQISPQEAAVWGTEVEAAIETNESGNSTAITDLQDRMSEAESDINTLESIAVAGVAPKASVRAATTANGTLASAFDNASVIDGVTLVTGNRILIKNQTAGQENGIYVVQASGAPVRATDADTAAEILRAGVFVEEGTTLAGTSWMCNTPAPITLETTPLTFVKVDDKSGFAAEISAARQTTPSLNLAINAAKNEALTELADAIFDTSSPVFRSGRPGSEYAILPTGIAGSAQPFNWSGTAFDMVKVWARPVGVGFPMRVGVWSADRNTLYASGYVIAMRGATPSFFWVKLDKEITTALTGGAGVLYLSFDGLLATSTLKQIGRYFVQDQNVPDLVTYPLYYTTWNAPQNLLINWLIETPVAGSTGKNGLAFELYSSKSAAKRTARLANPAADEIVMAPRLTGIVGVEASIYPASLISGREPKTYEFTGVAGRQLRERWLMSTAAPLSGGTLTIRCLDTDDLIEVSEATATIDIVAANAAAGAPLLMTALGDSLTANGLWMQGVKNHGVANPNGVQVTFQGTKGTGDLKHEAVSGRQINHLYFPTTAPLAADNPFVVGANNYFNADLYFDNNPGFSVPDVVFWHLGHNDELSQVNESFAQAVAAERVRQIAEMIGVEASANPVVPWNAVDPNIVHVVAVPIVTGDQDGAGVSAYPTQNYVAPVRHRYMHILRNRLVQVFRGMESSKIFLLPLHVMTDPEAQFLYGAPEPLNAAVTVDGTFATYTGMDLTPANGALYYVTDIAAYMVKIGPTGLGTWRPATAEDRIVRRKQDFIHPDNVTGKGGYQQMDDGIWSFLNVAKAKGWV